MGTNNGTVNTVIYNAGIPTVLGGLPNVTAEPDTISTNNISGSSGVYKVRIVTDVNRIGNTTPALTGTFSYDSSTPLNCTTAATCGTETIPFSRIRWNTRDNDTLDTVFQYDGSGNQVFQVQTDPNWRDNRVRTRHRNYYQFIFDNNALLPAGTYEGTVTISGSAN